MGDSNKMTWAFAFVIVAFIVVAGFVALVAFGHFSRASYWRRKADEYRDLYAGTLPSLNPKSGYELQQSKPEAQQ